ncbi:hypothetical protein MCOR07_000800 [Pyricularia oryzae]|uniref:Peroxisomal membrane protein PEX13 n=1 Tax=Pyricularia grisea TaxID=148305 RepID=A0ABQ8NQ36_PYRGI|nr:hypothetical protein MCOR33_004561 [Pyricularia grisea]KAI6426375.1 hypothetical protein MCOR21_006720 [Pyricularia oryzae]KAI6629571.1 hypothetical protein MCOR07_000800 [Pyricularia oryzae]
MASPPKPWERNGATAAAPVPPASGPMPAPDLTSAQTSGAAPAIPAIPTSLTSTANQTAAAYSRPMGAMGTSPYGGYGTGYGTGYGSAYSSPYGGSMYSRFGGYGGYGGGMLGGGYGSGMLGGGYGSGMLGGGYGGYGGMPGMQGDPNDPNSLTNRFGSSTQATFQMLEAIVGTFGGLAQMMESTYMTTASSFFAMISVAEQFGNLRETLGSLLGIHSLIRFLRTVIAKILGRPPPADAMSLTPAAFARFEGRNAPGGGSEGAARPSRKPLLFFILAAFGLPYLLQKAIKALAANEEVERQRRMELQAKQTAGNVPQLEFCRLMYDFTPPAQPGGSNPLPGVDLTVKKGDFVAVMSRTDPLGNPSEWWKCRTKDGRFGYLPANYLEAVPMRTEAAKPMMAIKAASDTTSRTSSLTSSVSAPVMAPMPSTNVGDITAESFQKSQFYS